MRTTVLPIELFELVIDSLAHEPTLRSASIVCKAWLTRSRFNLFRVVEFYLPTHLDRFIDLLQKAPILPISCKKSPSRKTPSWPSSDRPLHSQLWIPTRYDPNYLVELSKFTSITTLDLHNVTFPTVADFAIVLSALQHVTHLHVADLDCQRQLDPGSATACGGTLPFLTNLRIQAHYPTSIADWLLRAWRFPSIQHLQCDYQLDGSVGQGLGAFWAHSDYIEPHFDLSMCTALRALRVDCRHDRDISPDWTWLIFLISHLPRKTKPSITLSFIHSTHALATLHTFIPELDQALVNLFPRSVHFAFDHRNSPLETDADEEALVAQGSSGNH
ncbi:uncharacterized protein BXZ73DRAFT_98504 [Epithele typhae]|uniref:uncharacterized protein n=1 Tax=Epithele typhae TaxID=378194 RepID=UPI00200889C1|nr:uncharacterized protein BXZ73DRAFT_98504 [Epithele typhae]KAH9941288.1 hypothetical protein BXZ73DRAFT_98504 [Epithele typhae]